MATSPNYGWSEPDNTSLVKDGAQAMRTLGDAIDTSVWNVGFGQAGKNKIINGAMQFWARGTTATVTGSAAPTFLADRFYSYIDGNGSATQSRQTFTAGAAPVTGYESNFFYRLAINTLGTTTVGQIGQKIEDVRTFANQTVTFSVWLKADSARSFNFFATQNFGSGGSGSVTTNGSAFSVTTSWTRFSGTITVPSISGKTIGDGSNLQIFLQPAITSGFSLDVWGVQLEYGSKATPFQTASGGSIQGELAMCQRYYYREKAQTAYGVFGTGIATSTTNARIVFNFPVTLRTQTTTLEYSTLALWDGINLISVTNAIISEQNLNLCNISAEVAGGLTQFRAQEILANANTNAYIGVSAEL